MSKITIAPDVLGRMFSKDELSEALAAAVKDHKRIENINTKLCGQWEEMFVALRDMVEVAKRHPQGFSADHISAAEKALEKVQTVGGTAGNE